MRLMTSSRGIRVVVWILVFMTATPPTLLAQTGMSGQSGSPIPYGVSPGNIAPMLPGQPIVTNPTATQSLTPSQIPCPAAPPRNLQQVSHEGTSLNDFWPMEPSSVLPASAEERMRQERAEHQKGLALTDPLQAGQAGKRG